MKLVINRKTWARVTSTKQKLFDPGTCTRCCLGFLGLACGYTDDEMANWGLPYEHAEEMDTKAKPNLWPDWLVIAPVVGEGKIWNGTDLERKLVEINDNPVMQETIRERSLIKHFSSVGIKVEFKG